MASLAEDPSMTANLRKFSAPALRTEKSISSPISSRLLINHSLLPLSCLPRERAGEKIGKEAIFSQGVKRGQGAKSSGSHFFNTLLRL